MKESTIRKKARKIIEDNNGVFWFPCATRYHSNDIFGIFDFVSFYWNGKILLGQYTSYSNIRAREKKINKFFKDNDLNKNDFPVDMEVWGFKAYKPVKILDVKTGEYKK